MLFGTSLPLDVGDSIAGKYRIDAVIGAGGMGVVLLATHVDLDRKVAVKLIRPELTEDPAIVERLMLEARAAAGIRSEHVGAVLDVGRLDNGAPYIVMEFLEGTELGAMLSSRGRLPIIETVDLLMQVCEALAHAHSKQIVHRDLKPENLFVVTAPDGTRTVKVLDFGIAKQLGDGAGRALTNPATAVGSPQYMAPEQMQASTIDVRVDIWALGAILYEALSGQRAFDGDSVPMICAKVLADEPVPLQELAPHVPDALAVVVRRCLSKNAAGRFVDVAELAAALAPFGSPRSAAYLPRIRGVLGYPSSEVPSAASARALGYDGTILETGDSAVAPSGTERGVTVDGQRISSAVELPHERPKLWPVWLGAGVAVAAATGAWIFSRHMLEQEAAARAAEEAAASAASSDALAGPPTPTAVEAPSAPKALRVTSVQDAADAGEPTPAVRPLPKNAQKARETSMTKPKPRPVAVPKPVTKPPPSPANTPGSDAWDPDNFGGRH